MAKKGHGGKSKIAIKGHFLAVLVQRVVLTFCRCIEKVPMCLECYEKHVINIGITEQQKLN